MNKDRRIKGRTEEYRANFFLPLIKHPAGHCAPESQRKNKAGEIFSFENGIRID